MRLMRLSKVREPEGGHPSSGHLFSSIVSERTRLSKTETNKSGCRNTSRLQLARQHRGVAKRHRAQPVIFARGGALECDVPGTSSLVDLTSSGPLNVDHAELE